MGGMGALPTRLYVPSQKFFTIPLFDTPSIYVLIYALPMLQLSLEVASVHGVVQAPQLPLEKSGSKWFIPTPGFLLLVLYLGYGTTKHRKYRVHG